MKGEGEQQAMFSRRAVLLAGAQGLLVTALAGRLYYLGVVRSNDYLTLAEDNRISLRILPPHRGEIIDRFGRPMAENRQDLRVVLVPELAKDIPETLNRLGQIIDLSDAEVSRLMRRIERQRQFVAVTVASNLEWETFSRVNVESPNLPGILPDAGMTRYYPDGPVVAPVTGYVGTPAEEDLDGDPLLSLPGFKIGKRGIEKSMEMRLRGLAGTSREEVNAYGRTIREIGRIDGVAGDTAQLTIDLDLQRDAVLRMGEESAAAAIMDIHTGEVYAYASTPSFDPNDFVHGISRENWQALLRDPRKPLVNKVIQGQYPPGSTFKMVVAMAALRHGITDPEETVWCGGKFRLGNHTFHCWEDRGHGHMNMVDALARSCDTYFYTISNKLGIQRIAEEAERFGLGQVFDLPIPGESAGLIPTPGWKLATQGKPWVGGETVNVGIGQGALLATPMQLTVMTARLANGGKAVTPQLLKRMGALNLIREDFPDMGLSPQHLAVIRRGMEAVMEPRGTAYMSRLRGDQLMAGKTGTAQVRRITQAERDAGPRDQSKKPWRERHHGWFVGYAPVDNPRYAMTVLIEHGGGGSSAAAPVAKDLMQRTLELDPARQRVDVAVNTTGED